MCRKTASERENDYFVVERATASTAAFSPIGRVSGAGNSASGRQYSFRDTENLGLTSTMSYYRLRQVDVDGKESISPVVAIARDKMPASAKLDLYPNPIAANDLVQLQLLMAHEEGQLLVLYNASGQTGKHYPVTTNTLTLPTTNLQAGLYHVVLLDAAGQHLATQCLLVTSN